MSDTHKRAAAHLLQLNETSLPSLTLTCRHKRKLSPSSSSWFLPCVFSFGSHEEYSLLKVLIYPLQEVSTADAGSEILNRISDSFIFINGHFIFWMSKLSGYRLPIFTGHILCQTRTTDKKFHSLFCTNVQIENGILLSMLKANRYKLY